MHLVSSLRKDSAAACRSSFTGEQALHSRPPFRAFPPTKLGGCLLADDENQSDQPRFGVTVQQQDLQMRRDQIKELLDEVPLGVFLAAQLVALAGRRRRCWRIANVWVCVLNTTEVRIELSVERLRQKSGKRICGVSDRIRWSQVCARMTWCGCTTCVWSYSWCVNR